MDTNMADAIRTRLAAARDALRRAGAAVQAAGAALRTPRPRVGTDARTGPDGAAAALLNRAHEFTDLVLFVDPAEKRAFDAIDGSRTIGEIGVDHAPFFERLHEHDLVVIDASGS